MKVLTMTMRPEGRVALDGAMREVPLLDMEIPHAGGGAVPCAGHDASRADAAVEPAGLWQMGIATVKAGTSVLPVPFPTHELGFVLSGRVELIELPSDYDSTVALEEQAVVEVVGRGDAFRLDRGDRVWMEVLDDLSFVYLRAPVPPAEATCGGPSGL